MSNRMGEGTVSRAPASQLPAAAAIEARGLVKRYGDVLAVDDLSLQVVAGHVHGLLGPNGAGKTTTLRLLTGLIRADRGEVGILGRPLAREPIDARRVGALIERPAFYPYHSATDNLVITGVAAGLSRDEARRLAGEALARVGLASVARRRLGGFSTGMRQRLGIAAAILARPPLLILDEPSNGLDPEGIVDVRRLLAALAGEGITILLSSHLLGEVEQSCDRLTVMDRGTVVADGPTVDLVGGGGTLELGFASAELARAAQALLAGAGREVRPEAAAPTTLLVADGADDGEAILRLLAAAAVFPTRAVPLRPSLESRFLDLIGAGRGAS
ncbi:MAG TPA: ATP-binding cassette domain-containing protein [Candidatus Limnocylindrales bacterium]|nr:ATP-binding cassette domain-containing protein [Candidatus Limnocylindrales bacterium]